MFSDSKKTKTPTEGIRSIYFFYLIFDEKNENQGKVFSDNTAVKNTWQQEKIGTAYVYLSQ